MQCQCCHSQMAIARKVKIRRLIEWEPTTTNIGRWTPADCWRWAVYKEFSTYRWGVVCQGCYRQLDNAGGADDIGGWHFNIAGASRQGKATVINEAKYQAWQRRDAGKMAGNRRKIRIHIPESIRAQTVAFLREGMPADILADWLEEKGIQPEKLTRLRDAHTGPGALEGCFDPQEIPEIWVERLRPMGLLLLWSTLAMQWPEADRERLLSLLTAVEQPEVLAAWEGVRPEVTSA